MSRRIKRLLLGIKRFLTFPPSPMISSFGSKRIRLGRNSCGTATEFHRDFLFRCISSPQYRGPNLSIQNSHMRSISYSLLHKQNFLIHTQDKYQKAMLMHWMLGHLFVEAQVGLPQLLHHYQQLHQL